MRQAGCVAGVLILVAAVGGCQPDHEAVGRLPGAGQGQVLSPQGDEPLPAGAKPFTRIRIAFVELPAGMASNSEDIWSYLDEEPIQAARSASFGRNGFRIGRGSAESLPQLMQALRRLTGREVSYKTIVALPGSPTAITVRQGQPGATLFLVNPDRTISGADYPPGDSLLRLEGSINPENMSAVLLTGLPQIRSAVAGMRVVQAADGPKLEAQKELFSFEQLRFQLFVPNEGFLVIGPGVMAHQPTSLGHYFFIAEREGIAFEMVLIVIPEVLVRSGTY